MTDVQSVIVSRSSLHVIEALRRQHLNDLYEAQELYLELKVQTANVYQIHYEQQPIGYIIIDQDHTALEFYVINPYQTRSDIIFAEIVKTYGITKALCQSFDFTFLSCCLSIQKAVKVLGIHFREYTPTPRKRHDTDIAVRLATPADEPTIASINEEIFESPDEITMVITNQNMFIFEKSGDLLGFGIFQRVIPGRPEFDIGMLVHRNYRKQGYGTYIIQYLADYCQQQGWRPICGCAVENIGSRKCLEAAGFIARYRLLECTLV